MKEFQSKKFRWAALGRVALTIVVVTVLSCAATGDAGSGSSTRHLDDLAGLYAVDKGGQAEIKIGKEIRGYYVQILEHGDWSFPKLLDVASEDDLEGFFGDQRSVVTAALVTDGFGIFAVKPGAMVDGKAIKSGYVMFFVMTIGEVYKVS